MSQIPRIPMTWGLGPTEVSSNTDSAAAWWRWPSHVPSVALSFLPPKRGTVWVEISRTVAGVFRSPGWEVSLLDESLGLIHSHYQHLSQACSRATSCLSWCLSPFLTLQTHRDYKHLRGCWVSTLAFLPFLLPLSPQGFVWMTKIWL